MNIIERPWGYYHILYELPGIKVKELTVNPGCSLSMQRHSKRSEYWMVSEGQCDIFYWNSIEYLTTTLHKHNDVKIKVHTWHQLRNPYDVPCKLIEIQYGIDCVEEDIERRELND